MNGSMDTIEEIKELRREIKDLYKIVGDLQILVKELRSSSQNNLNSKHRLGDKYGR